MNDLLQIIIVLYKSSLDESLTYQSFIKNIAKCSIGYELIIYNNSPGNDIKTDNSYIIFNSNANDMLAGAYNYALQRAIDTNKKWILLLDQDTILTSEYFIELDKFLNSNNPDEYAAAVPILCKANLQLSPVSYSPRIGPYFMFKSIESINPKTKKCIVAFNSAALLNVSFMKSIGGFSSDYPLDMLDHWYFYQMYKAQKSIFILRSRLQQNLSTLDMETSMSIERYKKYLYSLKLFARELKFPVIVFFRLRLLNFSLSQLIRSKKRKFLQSTLKALFDFR